MSEQLLAALNPGQEASTAPAKTSSWWIRASARAMMPSKADRVEVDKTRQTVKLFDKSNALIGFYPATIGSEEKPSPSGTLKVTEVSRNPTYRYNPDYHFKGVRSDKPFTIKPGPNNPVGTVWISLSAEGYGIHGTPDLERSRRRNRTAACVLRTGMPSGLQHSDRLRRGLTMTANAPRALPARLATFGARSAVFIEVRARTRSAEIDSASVERKALNQASRSAPGGAGASRGWAVIGPTIERCLKFLRCPESSMCCVLGV